MGVSSDSAVERLIPRDHRGYFLRAHISLDSIAALVGRGVKKECNSKLRVEAERKIEEFGDHLGPKQEGGSKGHRPTKCGYQAEQNLDKTRAVVRICGAQP